MKFEEVHAFDQSAETVMRMYADRAFFDRKYRDLAMVDFELLDHQQSDKRFSVKYRLVMKSDAPLPEAAKKIIGDNLRITQQDSWDLDRREGRIDIEIKGAPLTICADMKLGEENGRGVNRQHWTITCKVPLVGGKIEKAVAEDIRTKSRADLEVSRKIILDY